MSERICVCYYCKKVYAISDKSNRTTCPKCRSDLINMRIDAEDWQRMSPDKQQRILDKIYNQNEEWREIDGGNGNSDRKEFNAISSEESEPKRRKPYIVFFVFLCILFVFIITVLIGIKAYQNRQYRNEDISNATETPSISSSLSSPEDTTTTGNVNDHFMIDGLFAESGTEGDNWPIIYVEGKDRFWVLGHEQSSDDKYLLKIDQFGTLYDKIKYKEGDYLIDEKYVFDEKSKSLYGRDGFDASYSFCGNNEEVVYAGLDTTGYTIWILRTEESYDDVSLILTAKDLNGNEKNSWDLREVYKMTDSVQWDGMSLGDIKYAGGAVYYFTLLDQTVDESLAVAFNVENHAVYHEENSGIFNTKIAFSVYADSRYVSFSYIDSSYDLWNIDGSKCSETRENGDKVIAYLGDNILYCGDESNNKYILNSKGERKDIDSSYRILGYEEGLSLVNIQNEKGTWFTGIINDNAELLFEPIKGKGIIRHPHMGKYEYLFTDEEEKRLFALDTEGNYIELRGDAYVYTGNNGAIEEALTLDGSIGRVALGESSNSETIGDIDEVEAGYDALLETVREIAVSDTLGEILTDDFNGDGVKDVVAEAIKSTDDECVRYFIFTDGTNTYRFGEYSNSVFYESQNMILPVGNEKHLVTSSKWRATALNGEMSHAAIYSIGTDLAIPLFDKEFSKITGINEDKGLAYVTYHEEATPGETDLERGILHDTGNKVEPFFTQEGVSSDYKSASVKPQSDPQSVWIGKKVQEVVGDYGIHFYVPADWEIYVEDEDHADGLDFSALDGNGHSGWIINTSCYHYEGTSTPFDWGEGQYVYNIGDLGNDHFFICLAAGVDDIEPQYNPDVYFPELKKYREMISNTAWIE